MTERLGFSVKEVADKLGIDRKGLYAAIKRREIRALWIGRRCIIPAPVLERLLSEGNSQLNAAE
jgi:excisionase family DNA binding protein